MNGQVDIFFIVWIVITMMLSAFFSGMEIAFVTSNRMLAQMDKGQDEVTQRFLSIFYRNPNGFVSTMLVGNNIVLVIYGILIARLFDATIFVGMDVGFTVPADTILSTLVILWPISKFATFLSRIFLKVFGINIPKKAIDEGFSKVDLDYLVQSSIDNANSEDDIENEVKIFHNALDFPDTKVRNCMIPRTEIKGVDINRCNLDELMQIFIGSGYSKIIVYKDDIDHIKGYIHSSEMFKHPSSWQSGVRTMPFVPETMAAQKLMKMLLAQKKSLAVVIDEFGGTSGLVALEDIVEEIFGDIEDEHDSMKYIATQTGKYEYLLSARLEIDKVNEMFELDLPESDDYMTVGGLILNEYRSFPKLNEVVKVGKFHFKILKSTMTKIQLVQLTVKAD